MKFIVYRRFKDLGISGNVDLAAGTELESVGEFVAINGEYVTRIYSDNYCRYFTRNDDGRGMERGRLVYAIAYADRNAGNGFRFSDDEQETLRRDWNKFLMPYGDVILFNNEFFDADVEELKRLADSVNVKVV